MLIYRLASFAHYFSFTLANSGHNCIVQRLPKYLDTPERWFHGSYGTRHLSSHLLDAANETLHRVRIRRFFNTLQRVLPASQSMVASWYRLLGHTPKS